MFIGSGSSLDSPAVAVEPCLFSFHRLSSIRPPRKPRHPCQCPRARPFLCAKASMRRPGKSSEELGLGARFRRRRRMRARARAVGTSPLKRLQGLGERVFSCYALLAGWLPAGRSRASLFCLSCLDPAGLAPACLCLLLSSVSGNGKGQGLNFSLRHIKKS